MYVFLKNNNIHFNFNHDHFIEFESPIDNSLTLQLETYKTKNYPLLVKILDPHGFLYSNIEPHNFSISKLNKDLLFYEFFEIFANVTLDNIFFIGNFSKNNSLIDYFLYKEFLFECKTKCDLCFFDIDVEKNDILKMISEFQNNNGTSIIKIECLKKHSDLVYFLTTIFENVSLFRPKILTDNYFYIICQNYNNTYTVNFIKGFEFGIHEKIPLYFLNIINEYCSIIEQRCLFYKSQIIFYSLHENNEKLKELKNKNIQNSIKWCETYGVPHNNIRINMFSDKITMI